MMRLQIELSDHGTQLDKSKMVVLACQTGGAPETLSFCLLIL
jgi:hypothetical protein